MDRGKFLWCRKLIALRKLFALALCFSFILTPLEVAFAQDGGTGTTPTDTTSIDTSSGSSSSPTPPANDFSIPGVDATQPSADANTAPDTTANNQASAPASDATAETALSKPGPAPLSAMAGFGGSGEPTIADPTVFTGQNAAPRVDGASGALTQTIPIDIPPGRNGLQPSLALTYNSQDGEDSIVGYGWSVSIPYIQLLNKTGSQNLYNVPHFTSSIDGELATSSNGTTTQTFVARIDDGHFNSYSLTNNVWTMYDKNGTRYTFGASDNAQQNASASSTKIYKWMLNEIRDTNNNYVRFTYTKDSGQIYPSQIIYTGNGGADGPFTVSFVTQARPDPYENYQPGFKVVTNYRISQINAAISGTTVRQYNLSYASGNNGSRSLLTSVQENGWNAAGAEVSYPAMTLGYESTSTQYVSGSPYGPSGAFGGIPGAGYVVADMNGDGRNDVATFYGNSSSAVYDAYSKQGNTSGVSSPGGLYYATQLNTCIPRDPTERGTRLVDLNADGKADLVQGVWNVSTATMTNALYQNTSIPGSYSFAGSPYSGTIPVFYLQSSGSLNATTGILGDVNGDGLPDFELGSDAAAVSDAAYFGNGSVWDDATTTVYFPPKQFASSGSDANQINNNQLIDVNGDGLPDWIYSDSSNTYVLLNTGTGWESTPDPLWTVATSTLYQSGSSYYDRGVRFLDINGDGLPDLIRAYQMPSNSSGLQVADYSVYMLNTGHGWATSTPVQWGPHIVYGELSGTTFDGNICYNEYGNFNGLGQHAQDVLSSITFPQGGTTSVTYAESVDETNLSLPYSLLTVASINKSDGLGTTISKSYTYGGAIQYMPSNLRDRKFAGFATSTETDGTTLTTTYFDQGISFNSSKGEQNDGWGQINHPYRIDVAKASDGTLLRRTFYRWDTSSTTGGNATFVFKAREMTQDSGPSGDHRDNAIDYSYSTTTGNVTQIVRYGEVSGNSDGTFSDIGSDKSTETFQYAVSTTTQATGLPYDDTLVDQSSNKARETRHTYDGLALGSVSIANETKTENWITGSTYASTTKVYDGTYGLVTQSRDADGNISTSTLDANHLYVATTTNPLFQATGYQYDYSTGKVKATYDPNNRLYTTTYDGYGRPLTSSIPDPATGALVTKSTYAYTDSNTPGSTSITQTDYLNSATSSVSYLYFDGLNRKLQSRKQAQNSNYAVKDWTYNNVGILNTESLPYFATGSSRASATTSAALFSTYSYDALQRITTIANSVGNTANAYKSWTVTTTDPNGKIKDYAKDAYGNLATVVEHITGSPATTTYAYDLNKNLTNITDSLGNIRNFTYDGVGNKLTTQDLHAAGDASFGTATSTYDAVGDVTQTVDAKNQTVNYTYDALNRVLTEDYTGSAGTDVSYAYDACQDGKGRLCAATTTDAVTNLTYNADGAVASEKKTIDGTAYTTSYNYDRQGNVTDMTYPDASVVKYGYDNNGLLYTIAREAPGGTKYVNAVVSIQYAPTGAATSTLFGDGVTTNKTYDSSQLYRLTHLNSVASTTQITSGGGSLGAARNALSKFALTASKASDVATKVASDIKTLQRAEAEPIAVSAAPVTLNTSTGTLITTSIVDMIAGKSAKERADIKGQQIANIGQIARVTRGDYDIQVVSMIPNDGGVAVFARVWGKGGQQIGFGRDGSVDIERFLIHNPPVLVPDATGSIARTWFNKATGATTTTRFREDAREALCNSRSIIGRR